jgi:hypothetical protein
LQQPFEVIAINLLEKARNLLKELANKQEWKLHQKIIKTVLDIALQQA